MEAPLDLDGLARDARAWLEPRYVEGPPSGWHGAYYIDPSTVLRLVELARLGEAAREVATDALALCVEVYSHTGPDGSHLGDNGTKSPTDPEVKVWVHKSTMDSMGGRIAALAAKLQER